MQSARKIKNLFCVKAINRENGFILMTVLILMVTLILVGATTYVVSSSNLKIGGNYKTSETVLQVAMAGAERAREVLRAANASSTTPSNFSEELAAHVGANGVLNGYSPSSVTDDTPLTTGTMSVSGVSYTYNAYLTNDSTDGVSSITDSNGSVLITSVANGPNGATATVKATVQIFTLSNSNLAALYSKDNTTLNGHSIEISGSDHCGAVADISGVYVYSDPDTGNTHTYTPNGSPQVTGNPAVKIDTKSLDLQAYIDSLKGSATVTLTADVSAGNNTTSYGNSSSSGYVTVYSDATQQADGELSLNNVTGYGVLLVKGNLKFAGNFNWHGIIIATGVVTTSGGGSNDKNIQGQVFSGASALGDTTVNGSVEIEYDSCEVKKSLSSYPLTVVNWKQDYN